MFKFKKYDMVKRIDHPCAWIVMGYEDMQDPKVVYVIRGDHEKPDEGYFLESNLELIEEYIPEK
jgi:hypothetical protein